MTHPESQSSESGHNAAERKKSNLAFAFFCMEKDRAKDMEIFYAFCRLMDDIADGETRPVARRKAELLAWRNEVEKIYRGEKDLSPLAEEMRGVIARRGVPKQYVLDIIDGVLTDTESPNFRTFEDIRKYCYGVAGAVGLVSIYIFGFKNERTKLFAETLGYALQFTNILRDVVVDAVSHGRAYIPARELDAFGVSREDLKNPRSNPACKKLFAFLYFRAKHFFNKARRLIAEEDRRALTPAFIMWSIYERILETIKERDFDITEKPVKISKPRKILLALSAIRYAKKPHRQCGLFGRAAVAGAGIAGVAAALRLAREGFDVEVFEARNSIGGRVCKISAYGCELDNAPHAAMGCYENLFGAFALCGGSPEDVFGRVSGMDFVSQNGKISVQYPRRFFAKSVSILGYAKLGGFASFANLKLLAKIKLGILPPESETAAEFLARENVPQQTIDAFWIPFCVSALNTPIEAASARLMARTLAKSVLKGFEAGILRLSKRPIIDAFEHFATYVEGVGGKINFSDCVKKINFENHKVVSLETAKSGVVPCSLLVSALPANALCMLLPEDSQTAGMLRKIAGADIANIYFCSRGKIISSDYACLVGSPLHWIFDHSAKLPRSAGFRLYSATISARALGESKTQTQKFLECELSKIFGAVEIFDVLPASFKNATISADIETERARPTYRQILAEFPNLYAVGDWVQSELPSTMESAAKSAFDLDLDK